MDKERRFYRFADSGNDYALIVQMEADSGDDARAEFQRMTGFNPDECPRVHCLSYDLNGWAHKSFMGDQSICPGCGTIKAPENEYCLGRECDRLKHEPLGPVLTWNG